MRKTQDESVGESFRADLLQAARDKSLAALEQVAAKVRPGMTEADAKKLLQDALTATGAPKSWHPPQIRFGANTLLAFGKKGQEGVPLAANDIFFLDIGPLIDGHEGDVGRAYAVGNDPEYERCAADVALIWEEVRAHWRAGAATGPELYRFAEQRASALGWQLSLDQANGHRIADFPHAVRRRGSIEAFTAHPAADRWILEIQIRHPTRPFGAFYEDLLG